MTSKSLYAIRWSTEKENGELPITYISLEAAVLAAKEWEEVMVTEEKATKQPAKEYRTEVYRIR